jgi:TRAP-type C4-dicarboxylate transport system permease small subunit
MCMLLLMIVVAFAQALLRNLTNVGMTWANTGLQWIDWADFVLSKGTLWLAFLGASLAVHSDQHVAIDVLPKLVSPRARMIMRGLVGLVSSVICLYLARAFWAAVLINGEERPADFEILTLEGAVHVCDATAAQLEESVTAHAGAYCYVRSLFTAIGVRMDTPGAAFQLIVPVMFVFMSARFIGGGIYTFMRIARGDIDDDPSEHGLAAVSTEVDHDLQAKKGG